MIEFTEGVPDGWMHVRVGGEQALRKISHIEREGGHGMSRKVPVLHDGEVISWTIGSETPDIYEGAAA